MKEECASLDDAVRSLIKLLNDNANQPHFVVVAVYSAALYSGELSLIKD